jgi:hypothetical protein
MKVIEIVKNKIIGWIDDIAHVETINTKKDVEEQQQNSNTELKAEISKLNSRISFMAEKIERLNKQQDTLSCYCEQILYNSSSNGVDDNNIETSFSTDKIIEKNEIITPKNVIPFKKKTTTN